uniref:BPTI/Kunitz inhibitor domain-containing protein n=1 Tax=Caenorhabditis japonica TaxID=281687 RepID=A0A8R1HI61_CAEJA
MVLPARRNRCGCAKLCLLLLSANAIIAVGSQLPDQLDPFLEKLFEFEECEDFLGSTEYNNIATSKCDPMTCDFPHQICARPAARFQDPSANTCRDVPAECLTAANGGEPVPPSVRPTPSPFMPQPSVPNVISPMGPMGPMGRGGAATLPPDPMAICQMGAPNGRFCGFRPMFTYNRETMQCDEFWFPGCSTEDTNANLFEDYQSCQTVADMCKPTPSPPTFPPYRPRPVPRTIPTPRPAPPTPPPAPAPSPFVDAFKSFGGGGNNQVGQGALGAIGMFTGSGLAPTGQGPLGNFAPNPNAGMNGGGGGGGAGGGDGQDLGLFGLIQQGIMGAQAAGQGKGGKEAASKAAGKILEQFTGFDLGGLGNNFGGLFG